MSTTTATRGPPGFCGTWRREGVLFAEAEPAIYVYHQVFNEGGVGRTRGAASWAACGWSGSAKATSIRTKRRMAAPRPTGSAVDRRARRTSARSSASIPIRRTTAQNLLEAAIAGVAPLEATDHLGVVHRMWPVTDVSDDHGSDRRDGRPAGLHRRRPPSLRNGLQLRDELAAAHGGSLSPEHPANFVLMMCVGMSDPGLLVLPTHRLFRGLPPMTAAQLARATGRLLRDGAGGQRPGARPLAVGRDRSRRRPGHARPLHGGGRPVDARPPDGRRPTADGRGRDRALGRLARAGREHPASAGRRNAARRARSFPTPKYVRDIEEVVRGLKQGDDAGRDATGQPGTRRPVRTGRPGHARHGRAHPRDLQPRRTDARQEHLLLSEAAQRAGDQSAGVVAWVRCRLQRLNWPQLATDNGPLAACLFHVKRLRGSGRSCFELVLRVPRETRTL